MTFSEQSRYNRIFQKVIHKGGELKINFIKRFHNSKPLEISVGDSFYEYQLMRNFLDNLQPDGRYSSHIAIHQSELSRQTKFVDKNYDPCLPCKLVIWTWKIW